jgi:aspartate/methionine/tyrosine aminotransferase
MKPGFVPFELERMMSVWENVVEYNISESGVHPMTLQELVDDPAVMEELFSTELNYPQTNGSIELRERIAALYPGAKPEDVLVTTGCAQANFCAVHTILQPGDELVFMLPNYMQIWGIAHNSGFHLKTFSLKEELGWGIDLDELDKTVSEKTKLIAICNPNNPSGHILSEAEMDGITAAADRVGAWLLADEIYAGAERLTEEVTPSFWGRYDKVLAMGSLSKAYGLPGLRLGWVVGPAEVVDSIWSCQDYVTISASMLANKLGTYALLPEVRTRILERTRKYIRQGYQEFEQWWTSHDEIFSLIPPQAAAIAFLRYNLEFNSTELVERLIHEKSVLVMPGDHFGLDGYLRISFGLPKQYLKEGLERIYQLIASIM